MAEERVAPWVWLLPTLLGLGLALCMLPFQAFILDDWVQLQALWDGGWDLFRFADGEVRENAAAVVEARLPWFSHPKLKLAFYRPLSSALHALDAMVFGTSTWGRGVHSALWYAALCGVATALYRRVLPSVAAVQAALLFAIAAPHVQPVVWFSARNALIAATFGGLALLAQLRGGWVRLVGVPMALAAALASSEAGLAAAALIAAHALFEERGRSRLVAVLPVAIVALGWAALYWSLGYGAAHSGAYLDPLGEPVPFLLALPGRLVVSAAVLLVGLSPELWYLWPTGRASLIAGCALAIAPVAIWLVSTVRHLPEERQRPLIWLGVGALLAMVPMAAGLLGSRSFVLPGLATIPIVVTLLRDPWRGPGLRGVRIALAGGLALAHIGFSASMWVLVPFALGTQRADTDRALNALAEVGPHETVVLLDAPSADVATYLSTRLAAEGRRPPKLIPLAVQPAAPQVERLPTGAVRVTLDDGQHASFYQLYRHGTPPIGFIRRVAGGQVSLVARKDGRVTLDVDVRGPARWLRWTEQGYEAVSIEESGGR